MMKTFARKFCLHALALVFAIVSVQQASAQVRTPRPSQKATVSQTLGVTDVTITYSRPGVKGRAVWGELVPYSKVWRTGANEATTFTVTDDVMINGQKLAAGTYSLHTIPTRDEWTIIFNKDAGQWGSFNYDEKLDALRVKAKPQAAEHQEWMSFNIDPVQPNSARVVLRWEKIAVPFTVEVPDVNTVTIEKARAAVASAKSDDWRTPLQAANFALLNNLNTEEATRWLEQSIKIQENYNNLSTKARLLAASGKTGEAITTAERAIQLGKQAKADTSDMEKRLAEWKVKKM